MSDEYQTALQEDLDAPDIVGKSTVLTPFELNKKDILFDWFHIKNQYKKYVFASSLHKTYNRGEIISTIFTLYKTIKPMMLKAKVEEYPKFIEEMESYKKDHYNIPEDKIEHVTEMLSGYLHLIGLTNITFEVKPWQDRFRDSYGVF